MGEIKATGALLPVTDVIDLGRIVKAEGASIYADKDGGRRAYLDFFCDSGAVSLGYFNLNKLPTTINHLPNHYQFGRREEAAQMLCELSGMDYCFFSNSGTEAVEAMLKLARKYQSQHNRAKIYTLKGSFHGRTYGAMSCSYMGEGHYHWDGYGEMVPGILTFQLDDLSSIDKDACAVLITPGSLNKDYYPYPKEQVQALGKYCKENGILLLVDEVQTYLRLGIEWGKDLYGVDPDIICTAKGVAGGVACGVTLCKEGIGNAMAKGGHFSTFGGNPVSIRGVMKVLSDIEDFYGGMETFLAGVRARGKVIREYLESMGMRDVQENGLLISAEIAPDYDLLSYRDRCLEEGLILGVFSKHGRLKLTPPLNVGYGQIERAMGVLKRCL